MALFSSNHLHKKNSQREQKVISKVNEIERKLLKDIEAYSQGQAVELAFDSLGNKYVFAYIGPRFQWTRGTVDAISNHTFPKPTIVRIYNTKTDAIYQMLYARMSSHGYVLCKHGDDENEVRYNSIEGWVLVEENTVYQEPTQEAE